MEFFQLKITVLNPHNSFPSEEVRAMALFPSCMWADSRALSDSPRLQGAPTSRTPPLGGRAAPTVSCSCALGARDAGRWARPPFAPPAALTPTHQVSWALLPSRAPCSRQRHPGLGSERRLRRGDAGLRRWKGRMRRYCRRGGYSRVSECEDQREMCRSLIGWTVSPFVMILPAPHFLNGHP